MSKWLLPALYCLFTSVPALSQEDTSSAKTLGEVIISVNKWEQKLNEVPNKLTKITRASILLNNPQTSADLLAQTGTVFIQKSQLGGGSPMIRGFATNRVLLVIDGVRMNNAIYRSGNLQNIISIDALSIEAAEVVFGPGSLIYGSDAIGGVMDFHTLEARLSGEKKMLTRGSISARHSTANKEKTLHGDINLGWKKWALLSAFTYSDYNDLKMGRKGGQESYLRPEFVVRENNMDVIIKNAQPRVQRFSGYNQINIMQKIRFRPNEHWNIQYGFTYAGTGTAPRYDRLLQYRNGALRFAEWNYGPMLWRMHNVQVFNAKKNKVYDEARLTIAYQDYQESRIDRTRDNNNRNRQEENVNALSINVDALKSIGKGKLFYGLEHVYNKVGSSGVRTHIITGETNPIVSRYPDGSTWKTTGIYGSYKINPHPRVTVTGGLRYSINGLDASFDTSFIKFPYSEAKLREGALTGNAGLVFRPTESSQLNAHVSTGFRMPNIDDIGKFFESIPGVITVPNPALRSEYAWNIETGFIKNVPRKYRAELNVFYTVLNNAIVRRPFLFNGNDSIFFNGVNSGVEALQNVARATVWGVQASFDVTVTEGLAVQSHANWTSGKETDDVKNEQVPLRHAPPFFGNTLIKYNWKKLGLETSAVYNSIVRNNKLAPSEQVKREIYATDSEGKPYSPGWYTLNVKASFQFTKNLLMTTGWENITNQRYRPYSSGIVAAGSNFIFSIRCSL